MAKPWMESVKTTGELSVYKKNFSGIWKNVFMPALESFNKLNKKYELGVKMVPAKDEAQANIVMHVSDKVAKYTFDGTTEVSTFDGKAFHGATLGFGTENEIRKAAIFLPSDPQTQAGFIRGKAVYEKANQNMMRVVAVHELIHACCLDDNKDHATNNDGVFAEHLTSVGGKLVSFWSGGKGTPMPPMFLDPATVAAIQSFWS